MAHFAQLDSNNHVINVIVVGNDDCLDQNGNECEEVGISFCQKIFKSQGETVWRQTSYNSDGRGFRGNYAGIGMTYMTGVQTLGVASTDIFIDIKQWDSWHIGINTAEYFPPDSVGNIPQLTKEEYLDGKRWDWDESLYNEDNTKGWVMIQLGGNCEGCEDTSMVW